MQKIRLILALWAGLALSGVAQAALIDRGDGLMNWNAANTWTASCMLVPFAMVMLLPKFPSPRPTL